MNFKKKNLKNTEISENGFSTGSEKVMGSE
jgi:hypothetical protein